MGEKIATAKEVKAADFEWYAASSHGDDAYAITIGGCGTSYEVGRIYAFKADVANTGACTLNINAIGALAIKKNLNVDLATDDILAGQIVVVVYDGTNFQIVSKTNIDTNVALGSSDAKVPSQLAVKSYVDTQDGLRMPASGAFGTWADISANADGNPHQVSTDGFIVGYCVNGYNITIKTDAASTPTVIRAKNFNAIGQAWCVPVKKNHYYIIGTVGGENYWYWLPLGT